MSDAPYSCYYEVISASTTVGSEFFQCFDHFTQKNEDFLCLLSTSSISIYHVKRSSDDTDDDLDFEGRHLELRFHQRVFGHMQSVKKYFRGEGKSDILFLAMDSGKLLMAEYLMYEANLIETIVCNLELGNNNPSLDGKQHFLGHGSKPALVVSEEYHAVALLVFGEQIFSCTLVEDVKGSLVVDKKLITHLQSDLLLTGPVMDICFVGGYGNATCAILQQDHLLSIGHAAKVLNTSSVSVLGFNYDNAMAALIWRVPSMPHDAIKLVSITQISLPGAILVISQNAVIAVHQDSTTAVPTNGFASVTVGTNTNIVMKPWKGSGKGLTLCGSKWVQFGLATANEGSFMGILRDGTMVLLHLSYYTPRQSNTLDMELVVFRENFPAHFCCISRNKPELLFVSSRNGHHALFRLGYNTFIRQVERDRDRILYPQSFLSEDKAFNSLAILEEEENLYGVHGLDVEKVNSSQWIVDLRLLDILSKSGPITHGMVMKPDDTFSQIDHVRWNRTAHMHLANYSSAASYIPERESKDAMLFACGLDKDASLNRFFSGIAYSKSATKSFPGGKTMYSVNIFGISIVLLVFANKTRVFRCEVVNALQQGASNSDLNVKLLEWAGEDSGFIVNAKSLFVGVLHHTDEFDVIVQVTPTSIRILKVFTSFESEPIQDMSLHDSVEIGGLGGVKEEVFITADASAQDGNIVLVSSHLNTYFIRYHSMEESMELINIHRDPDAIWEGEDAPFDQGHLPMIDSAIISASIFVGKLNFLECKWSEAVHAVGSKHQYSELELEEIALYGSPLHENDSVEDKNMLDISTSVQFKIDTKSSKPLIDTERLLEKSESYAIITDKKGTLYIFRLEDMTCVSRTDLVSLQRNHIPLQRWYSDSTVEISQDIIPPGTGTPGLQRTSSLGTPSRATSNGHSFTPSKPSTSHVFNDESFIVETKLFAYKPSNAESTIEETLHLAVIFSSGEMVLYRLEEVCEFHIALNRLLTQTVHSRRYPGVPFVRGINNSEANEIPAIFMTSKDVEYICRMPPTISVMQHPRSGTRVYIAAHDSKQLCFDRNFPVLLPLDFPETPLVNFGYCTLLPLFPEDASILATLWFEYEDLDTTAEIAKLHRIKNKPLKQSTFGIYRQLPRQMISAGMNGTMQAVSVEKTVHKCMEIARLTDNKTEQALLEKRTYMLLCSQDVFRPFNPHVITEEDGDTENVEYERYFPNLESFQQPNADLAPLPLSKSKEYRVCLMQNGKIIDNFLIDETEKVLDATVLYLSVEKMTGPVVGTAPTKTFEKRVFVLVSTLYVDKRGEDTQGNGRMLLLSLDYAMFEDDEKVTTSVVEAEKDSKSLKKLDPPVKSEEVNSATNNNESENGHSMDVDPADDYDHLQNKHNGTSEIVAAPVSADTVAVASTTAAATAASSQSKQSLAQQQFLGSIQAKLRQIWVGPGPSSVVHQMPTFSTSPDAPPGAWSNYVLATVGPILYVYKFNSETMELSQVSFYFASFYISALSVMKQYILLSDMLNSVQLLYFREEDFSLHLVSKDFEKRVIMKTEIMVDGKHIGFVTADDGGHIQIFQNNPKKHESLGGSRLLCLSDFNLGSPVSWMTSHDILYPEQKRIGPGGVIISSSISNPQQQQQQQLLTVPNPTTRIPPGVSVTGFRAFTSGSTLSSGGFQKKVSNFPLQQFGVRMLKTTVPIERKTCTIISTIDGGLAILVPMEEKMFKRLLLLEQIMNMLLPTTLALNPRDYRLLYPSNVGLDHHRFASPGLKTVVTSSNNGESASNASSNLHYQLRKTILDGCSLFRYLELEYAVQEEIAQMIGSHAILVRENLREIEHVVRFY